MTLCCASSSSRSASPAACCSRSLSLSRARAPCAGRMIVAIDFFRAVPPLVLLIFVYSGLPFAGIRLSPLAAVALAFFLNTSSYYGEIYRAGIESVGARPMGCGALDRPQRAPDARLRRAAAGDAQRAARPRLQHRRGGEAHLDRQRGGACPSCSIPPTWRARSPSTPRRSCLRRRSISSCCGRWCGWSAGSSAG